jgi:hypothetical protein
MTSFELEAARDAILGAKVADISGIPFTEVSKMPESTSQILEIAGARCTLSVFCQRLGNHFLVTVQIAQSVCFGLVSRHWERGVVFSANYSPREATPLELQNSGG